MCAAAWATTKEPTHRTWVRQARWGRRRVLRGVQAQQVVEPALHLVAQGVPAVPPEGPGQQYQGSAVRARRRHAPVAQCLWRHASTRGAAVPCRGSTRSAAVGSIPPAPTCCPAASHQPRTNGRQQLVIESRREASVDRFGCLSVGFGRRSASGVFRRRRRHPHEDASSAAKEFDRSGSER